jgi:hypothetical protein
VKLEIETGLMGKTLVLHHAKGIIATGLCGAWHITEGRPFGFYRGGNAERRQNALWIGSLFLYWGVST